MSKFFQALENAEKERTAEATGAARTAAAPVADLPAIIETPRNGAHPEPIELVPAIAPDLAPARTTEPPAPPPEAPAPESVRVTAPTATADTGARVGYGAPVARRRRGKKVHAGAFVDELAAVTPGELGDLDDHLVSLLDPTGFAAEQYRTVRLAIETFRRERGVHVVAISSAGRGEGKTMSAINLAGALAQSPDARVVLVDVDLRHPRVAEYLGLPPTRGLSTYLLDHALVPDAIIERPTTIAFSVVTAGPVSTMPYELMKSPRLAALFQDLRSRFDFVVVDTPPVLLFPDVGILRDIVDGFVMVVRANRTPREGLSDGLDTVGRHRVLGLVWNDDDRHAVLTSDEEPEDGWFRSLLRPFVGVESE